jgi:hypothetical protein
VPLLSLAWLSSPAPDTADDRFILTASLTLGFGAILVLNWFSFVFTCKGNNHAIEGFFNAIVLVMETGFAVTALVAMLLNLLIREEVEQDARLLEGNQTGAEDDDRNSGEDEIDAEKIRSSLLRLLLLKMKHNTMGYRA